jgi:hypothetical protein
MTPVPVPPAPDGPPQPARALPELLRELADAAEASGTPYRHAYVHAESLRAWADEVEALQRHNAKMKQAIQWTPGFLEDYATTVDAAGAAIAKGEPVQIAITALATTPEDIARTIRRKAAELRAALAR